MSYRQVWRLRSQHRQLEQMIREESRKPDPDHLRIQALKRQKLQVKDELFLVQAGLVPVTSRIAHA